MTVEVIKLAIMAVGGQGGGVLADWIVNLAERNGWYAQATSVPGVSQRTGATIYYVEMTPETAQLPVLALMPSPGDVDIILAAELVEAGRAITRGFVSPDRTILVASSHRILAIAEKMPANDGAADSAAIVAAANMYARRFLHADLEAAAKRHGSVISASLFGALCGARALPFEDESFESAIKMQGKGVADSLAAFRAGREAITDPPESQSPQPTAPLAGSKSMLVAYDKLLIALERRFPSAAHEMLKAGLAKTVDFQDLDYGREYLDRVASFAAFDHARNGFALTIEAAKHVANAMCYDDIIRVADRKTRTARFSRIAAEHEGHLRIVEYMHPRGEEICSLLPARLGGAIMGWPGLFRMIDHIFNRGYHMSSTSLISFGTLYLVAGLRRARRRLLRHRTESESILRWLAQAEALASDKYDLAVELLRCRRLIKGYSDTYARGVSKFDLILGAVPLLEKRHDGAAWLRRLREAAMQDEDGEALDGVLATIRNL